MPAIYLEYHLREIEPGVERLIADAIDWDTDLVVTCGTLHEVAEWLHARGYAPRTGSNGVFVR